MKNIFILILLLSGFLAACSQEDCPEGINTLPMYGRVKKCKEQIEVDKKFIDESLKLFPSRDSAYRHHVMRGWQYLSCDSLNTSMKRFNQAWLLDSTKAEAYWGFGALLGRRGEYKESIDFFEKALHSKKINSSAMLDGNLLRDAALSYGNYFFNTKKMSYLVTAIKYLKESLKYNSDNPMAYHDLTVDYFYYGELDSARKYMVITEKYDPKLIDNELRKMVDK